MLSLPKKTIIGTVLLGAIFLSVDVFLLLSTRHPPKVFEKDVVQFYLMAKAAGAGKDVYSPIPALAKLDDPRLGGHLQHASAYPPPSIFLGTILGQLSYGWAVVLWTSVELIAILLTIVILTRELGAKTPVIIVAVFSLAWMPVLWDLWYAQVMLTITLLLTACWLLLRRNSDALAGVLLGLVLALKLYAWPIALFLILRRRWNAVVASVSIFLCLNLFSLIYLGKDQCFAYYIKVGPSLLPIYVNDLGNFSAWATGFKLFGKSGAILFEAGSLILALFLTLRVRFDWGFMIVLTVSAVLSPVSWIDYLSTLVPAFCFVASQQLTRAQIITAAVLLLMVIKGFWAPVDRFPLMYTIPFTFIIAFMVLLTRVARSSSSLERNHDQLALQSPDVKSPSFLRL